TAHASRSPHFPYTTLFRSKVSDLRSILDDVESDLFFQNSRIYMADFLEIVPGLSEIEFFRDNRKDVYTVDLAGRGTLNDLQLSQFQISAEGAKIVGSGQWKQMFVPESRSFSANIRQAYFPTRFLKRKFPKVDFPTGVDSLSYVSLYGTARMNKGEWSVHSRAQTRLGNMELDAAIDTRRETYNGQVKLESFELGKFVQNPHLGPLSMRIELEEGSQFNIRELSGHLNTTVDSFMVKGYDYGGLRLYGFFGNNSFLGHVALDKEAVAFDLDTKIDFNDLADVVVYARVRRADLQKMKLINQNLKLRRA